ncbi:hypothetical protein BAE44_0012732, partial [Dichanthelium oligosanthes]
LQKSILPDAACERCHAGEETCDHLIFMCSFAQQFWCSLGIDPSACSVSKLWTVPRPTTVPLLHFDSFIPLCYWHI